MKTKNSKMPYFLFYCFLFLLIGFNCVKPFITRLIGETYIGPEFSDRIYGTVMRTFPEFEYDKARELGELIKSHPQIYSIIHRYICAYADFINGDEGAVKAVDNDKAFEIMNKDILEWIKERNTGVAFTVCDEEFLALLAEDEKEVEEIFTGKGLELLLEDIQCMREPMNEMSMDIVIIEIYRVVTSWWMQVMLFLFMVLAISPIFVVYSEKFFNNLSQIFLIQGCFWSSIYILHRMFGRSMYSVTTPIIWRGVVLITIGILILILKLCIFRKDKER